MSEVKDLIFSQPGDSDIPAIQFGKVFGPNHVPSCEQPEWDKFTKLDKDIRPACSTLKGIRATNDNVIVRVKWRQPVLAISDEKKVRTLQPDEKVIVAYGGQTEGVNIGDKVFVSYHATIEPIRIQTNDMSLEGVLKARADHKNAEFFKGLNKKVTVCEYYIVPVYAIKAVLGNVNDISNEVK
jgi:hypothetical protein